MLTMKIDAGELERKFQMILQMPRTIEKAMVGAVAETVNDVHRAQLEEMKISLDKDSPYLKRGLWKIQPFGQGKSIGAAGTRFNNTGPRGSPAAIIAPNIKGGPRGNKASAKALQAKGILPKQMFTIEGRNYPRDSKGNIARSRYGQMLEAVGALTKEERGNLPKSGQKDRKNVTFFVMKDKAGKPLGIAERKGRDVKIMLVFVDGTKYREKYDYHGVGKRQLAYSLPRHFDRILMRYMDKL
jgi:hypothetical protein